MNIEEAKEKIKEISYGTGIFLTNYEVNSKKVLEILDQLDKPKPEVPQCVADWIEECEEEGLTLKGLFSNSDMPAKIFDWIFGSDENCRLMAEAWINGYTVEKEKKYKVRDKRLHPDRNYLNFDKCSECWLFSNGISTLSLNASHTRKALEESGFNVFDDDNYEVIEVTE